MMLKVDHHELEMRETSKALKKVQGKRMDPLTDLGSLEAVFRGRITGIPRQH